MKLNLSISTLRFLFSRCQDNSLVVRMLLATPDDLSLLIKHISSTATSKDIETEEEEIEQLFIIQGELRTILKSYKLHEEYIQQGPRELPSFRTTPLKGRILYDLENEEYTLMFANGAEFFTKNFCTLSKAYIEYLKLSYSKHINSTILTKFKGYQSIPRFGAMKGHITLSDDNVENMEDES